MKESINRVFAALKKGSPFVLIDDGSDPALSYLCCAGGSITAEQVSFLVNHGRGVLSAALSHDRLTELGIAPMGNFRDDNSPQFTVSVEARQGVSTGISAADRAKTIRVLAETSDPKRDLVMPGHIFPVSTKKGGVLVKHGAPEAMIDLLCSAHLPPVAAFTHILDDHGGYLSSSHVLPFGNKHDLPVISVSEIVHWRMSLESIVEKLAESTLPTRHAGIFRAVAFRSLIDDAEHLALIKGLPECTDQVFTERPVIVRVQSEHRIGDLLGTDIFQHRQMLDGALEYIHNQGEGVFVYIRHPQKNFLRQQIEAAQSGLTPHSKHSQLRELGVGAQILKKLGVRNIRLLTNSNRIISGLNVFGLTIVERLPYQLGLPRLVAA